MVTTHHKLTEPTEKDTSDVIVVSLLGSGWAAVQLTYSTEDFGSFWEPWTTGFGRYATREEAIVEARQWSENEGIRLSDDLKPTEKTDV